MLAKEWHDRRMVKVPLTFLEKKKKQNFPDLMLLSHHLNPIASKGVDTGRSRMSFFYVTLIFKVVNI